MTTFLESAAALGEYMRTERKLNGWSLEGAARNSKINNAVTIGSYERGDRTPPLSAAIAWVESYGLRLAVIGPEDVVVRGNGPDSRVQWMVLYGDHMDGLIECESREEAERIWEHMPGSRVAFRTQVFGELTFAGEGRTT